MKIIFFLLLSILTFIRAENANAIKPLCPFRNGRVYLAYTNQPTIQTGKIRITYDFQIKVDPSKAIGCIFGLRSFEMNGDNNFMYYSFVATNITTSQFLLNVNLQNPLDLNYSKIIVDYFAGINDHPFFQIFTILPEISLKQETTINQKSISWNISSPNTLCQSNKKMFILANQLNVEFIQNNFTMVQSIIFNPSTPFCQIKINFHHKTKVFKIKLSGFNYLIDGNIAPNSQNQYKVDHKIVDTTNLGSYDISSNSFPTLFVGLTQTFGISNKIGFSFQYASENNFILNNNMRYFKNNVEGLIYISQNSNPIISHSIVIFEYFAIGCRNTYFSLYLKQQQRCQNIIVPQYGYCGQDTSTKKPCNTTTLLSDECSWICSTNSNSCPFPIMYYNTSVSSQVCLQCNTINKCIQCKSLTSTKATCTKCQNGYTTLNDVCYQNCLLNYFLNSSGQCQSCQIITYCSQCSNSTGILKCSKCIVSDQFNYYLVKYSCIKCDITHYYDIATKQCKLCSETIQNCLKCSSIYDQITCLLCNDSKLPINNECNGCQIQQAWDNISSICQRCDTFPGNCKTCQYNASSVLQCTSCHLISNYLHNGICISCQSYEYFSSNSNSCQRCDVYIPQCIKCQMTQHTFTCLQCQVGMIFQDNKCIIYQPCLQFQFLNLTTSICQFCNLTIDNCKTCYTSGSQTICSSCYSQSQMIVQNNICVICSENQYYQDGFCKICSQNITNCNRCFFDVYLICLECDQLNKTYLQLNQCKTCQIGQYFYVDDRSCKHCSQYCISCTQFQNCLECQQTHNNEQIILQNGKCSICNSSSCQKSKQQVCYFSNYNQKTLKCQSVEISQIAKVSMSIVVAIPTINLVSEAFAGLIGLFDDLSYYSYHNRSYSSSIIKLLDMMKNTTIQRLLMPQIEKILSKVGVHYDFKEEQNQQELIFLINDLHKTPYVFKENDNDVYFTKTSYKLWTGSVPITIIIFLLLAFLHYLINKKCVNQLFRKYSYLWMIVVSVFSQNLQFLSFKCFQQLYQIVPIDFTYNLNLVFCYLILFFIITYSITSIILIINYYSNVSSQYIIQQLFYQSWAARLIMINLLKLFQGFIHAYFYYNSFLQQSLLFFTFFLRFIVYLATYQCVKNLFSYFSFIIDSFLMIILQTFFMIEIPLMQLKLFDGRLQQAIGQFEVLLILLMVINRVFMFVALPLKDFIISQIAKIILSNLDLNTTDITVVRYKVERKLMKKQFNEIQQKQQVLISKESNSIQYFNQQQSLKINQAKDFTIESQQSLMRANKDRNNKKHRSQKQINNKIKTQSIEKQVNRNTIELNQKGKSQQNSNITTDQTSPIRFKITRNKIVRRLNKHALTHDPTIQPKKNKVHFQQNNSSLL